MYRALVQYFFRTLRSAIEMPLILNTCDSVVANIRLAVLVYGDLPASTMLSTVPKQQEKHSGVLRQIERSRPGYNFSRGTK